MIDKEKISNLISDKKFKEVINEFSAVFLEKLKTILDFYKIDYNDDITLIECISIIEFKVISLSIFPKSFNATSNSPTLITPSPSASTAS